MTKLFAILALFSIIFLAACQDNEKEQQLVQREQLLLEKEKQFALKEADYQLLQKMRDSLSAIQVDTPELFILPTTIIGSWNSKVVCVESNCSDYVVGDQRNDSWEFAQDSSQVIVKNINNNTIIRVYTGSYNGSEIRVGYKTDSAAAKQVAMNVVLNDIQENKIKGIRTVSIDDKCSARFSVDLERVKGQP